jgi:hypothetical protein
MATPASCAEATDGRVDLQVSGGTAPWTYDWSNGSDAEALEALEPGIYQVVVTDAQGCTFGPIAAAVDAGSGPQAGIMPSAYEVMLGEPIEFFNFSTNGAEYLWDLGDGNTTEESEPIHVYALPGVYQVTLVATVGECSAQAEVEVVVNISTAIGELPESMVHAWTDGYRFIVDWRGEAAGALDIDVLDAGGRVVLNDRRNANDGMIMLPAARLPNGIYFLRVASPEGIRTFKLPLAR